MRVLVACEYSGVVRAAFAKCGHWAVSCDTLASEEPWYGFNPWHYQGDIAEILERRARPFYARLNTVEWDLLIAHPPCTYLCSSGLHWNGRVAGRAEKTEEALRFIEMLWRAPIPRKALENPQGCINTRLPFMPKPQYVQPYDFGEDASKKTGLWMDNLPTLVPTQRVPGRRVWDATRQKMVERWSNQTDSGQNKLAPSDTRWKERSRTYQGIADAMAEQWGVL